MSNPIAEPITIPAPEEMPAPPELLVPEAALKMVQYLNSVHRADPTLLQPLLEHRVPCNKVAEETTNIVPGLNQAGEVVAGPLGVINGILLTLCGLDWRISAAYDANGQLKMFALVRASDLPQQLAAYPQSIGATIFVPTVDVPEADRHLYNLVPPRTDTPPVPEPPLAS